VPDDLDEFLDGLPGHLRRKVLDHWGHQQDVEQHRKLRPFQKWKLLLGITVSIVWGLPVVVIGLVLTSSVVFAPIGIPILIASGWPLQYVVKRQLEATELKEQQREQ
jgi:hypothetical protein